MPIFNFLLGWNNRPFLPGKIKKWGESGDRMKHNEKIKRAYHSHESP
jgi:hypothetical protein